MLRSLQQWFGRRNLKSEEYAFLFEPPQDLELICFDCETTGLNPKKAELLSIGAVKIKGNTILTSQKLELFIKPRTEINEVSIKIHRLRHCDLEHGLSPNEAILRFLHFIGSRPLVGYFLEFDVAMINKYLKPLLGITLPNQQFEVSGLYYNHRQNVLHPVHVDLRFDAILADLDIPVLGKHDAFNDALMTAMIYVKLQGMKKMNNE
jgi:DNA polymerase-3 subunit epsilon